jgi:hypothetical protein
VMKQRLKADGTRALCGGNDRRRPLVQPVDDF